MKDKYNLTREENVFLARKRWDESIYSGMRMENRNVTFPQTQTILEGINVAEVELSDVQAILNMRDAWKFLLDSMDKALNTTYLCSLQERVAFREALVCGSFRTGSIGISGVRYIPPIPDRESAEVELTCLLSTKTSTTNKALEVFTWIARSQLFWDGNKRTALLAANKILIENGAGILLIPDENMLEFSTRLSNFYESGDNAALKDFLYGTSLFGIDSSPAAKKPQQKTSRRTSIPKHDAQTAFWLKHMRKQHGVTQKNLAIAIGVAPNSIANIEQGQRKGSDEIWTKIEEYFAKQEQGI
jgi:DNA-binding XRE family transcriptional regulator